MMVMSELKTTDKVLVLSYFKKSLTGINWDAYMRPIISLMKMEVLLGIIYAIISIDYRVMMS